ncbi:MAG: hypothetical protein ACQCXQ_13580 [Verrucomicrobiales bacterium]|nr:hypothetical protein [Verrucomicrobiota bacterium JB025]
MIPLHFSANREISPQSTENPPHPQQSAFLSKKVLAIRRHSRFFSARNAPRRKATRSTY